MSKTHLLIPVRRIIFIDRKEYEIELNNDLTISFREHGKKTRFITSLADCYNLALIRTHRQRKAERNEGKITKRKYKCKDIAYAFDKVYAKVLQNSKG